MKRAGNDIALAGGLIGLLLGLPLLGVGLAGKSVRQYMEFPPLTRYVQHAPFTWMAFLAAAALLLTLLLPFDWHVFRNRKAVPTTVKPGRPFPWWGWAGLGLTLVAWILAWTRFPWFAPLQPFTFSPLWFGYILVVNALALRRTGHCLLIDRTGYMLRLFLVSAVFWWFFEYLNRFVQNWYYAGVAGLSPVQYFLYATLPFSTVLPAVLSTYELLASEPRAGAGLDTFRPIAVPRPRIWAGFSLVTAAAGLAAIGVWPDRLFPLLWLAPLILLTAIQALRGRETLFTCIRQGRWRRLYLLAMAALICGFFWEMWNYCSLAKWLYEVPLVGRFKIFEMPLLGFAGYLPFGWECAVVAEWALAPEDKEEDKGPGFTVAIPTVHRAPVRHTVPGLLALLAAAAIWLPCLHLFFRPTLSDYHAASGIAPRTRALAARHLALWSDSVQRRQEIARMRNSNAEWDFMGRTFLVLSLANMSLRQPAARAQYLEVVDAILAETIRLEKAHGVYYFLMDYARDSKFIAWPPRSLFQDGEIALMLAARRMIAEKPEYQPLLAERVDLMVRQMEQSPVLCGESYPDECWMFCNTVALAAIRMADLLDGTDHEDFIRRWLACARQKLADPQTGLLISSFTFDGQPLDGPEGSSIWMVAHCLQVVDPVFAAEQYHRARRELAGSAFGFGYAREWPAAWRGRADVDSGPVLPILQISAGSSGLAFLGAAAFGDDPYLRTLLTSLDFGGFPEEKAGNRRYLASNQVGDSVLLYALVQGPLWEEVRRRSRRP